MVVSEIGEQWSPHTGARAAGGNTDVEQRAVAGEDGCDNGDQDAERAPGRAGGKGQHARDKEDDGGQHIVKALRGSVHQIVHIVCGTQRVERGLEGDGQCQDDDREIMAWKPLGMQPIASRKPTTRRATR